MAVMLRHIECNSVIGPDQTIDLGWIRVERDVLPDDLISMAHKYILNQGSRKVRHNWPDGGSARNYLSWPIGEVVADVADIADNTAVTKRYVLGGEASTAYRERRVPSEFSEGGGIANPSLKIATMGGYAIFFARRDMREAPLAIACRPNTLVVAYEDAYRSTTPPLGETGIGRFVDTQELPTDYLQQGEAVDPRTIVSVGSDRNYGPPQ